MRAQTMQRAALWLCLLALVAGQAIGLMHRIVHAPLAVGSHVHAPHAHGSNGHAWTHDLFAGHEDDSTCRLLDAAGADGITATWADAPPAANPQRIACPDPASFTPFRTALFLARAPPASSFA